MRRIAAVASFFVVLSVSLVSWAAAGMTPSTTTAGQRVTMGARVTLRAYAALVEQRLGTVLTALSAVAAGSDASSGQWDRIRAPLAAVRARVSTAAVVWYVEPDGSYYTTDAGLASKNLSGRSYFAPLMAGQDIEGPLVVSKATGKTATIVAAPVRAGGRVIGGVGASIDLVKLAKSVQRQLAFPSNVVFYAIDSSGRCALNKDTSLIFSFPSNLGSPSLRAAVHEMLATTRGSLSYHFNGAERTVVFKRSRSLGWTFAIGVVGR